MALGEPFSCFAFLHSPHRIHMPFNGSLMFDADRHT